MRIQHLRQPLGNAGDADVPGDVPRQFALGDAEIAERTRQDVAVMVRCEQERRCALCIHLMHWWNIASSQELIRRLGCV